MAVPQGNPEAINAMLARHEGLIRWFLLRIAGPMQRADADDIVQDVMIGLWRAVERVQPTGPVIAFIRGIAKRQVITALGTRRKYRNALKRSARATVSLDEPADRFGQTIGDTLAGEFDDGQIEHRAEQIIDHIEALLPPAKAKLARAWWNSHDRDISAVATRIGYAPSTVAGAVAALRDAVEAVGVEGELPRERTYDPGPRNRRGPVKQYTRDGDLIATHSGLNRAARAVNGHATNIARAARTAATAHGFLWRYSDSPPITPRHRRATAPRQVQQLTLAGEIIATHDSAEAAARAVGSDSARISRAARGRLKSSCGFVWKYAA